MLWIFGMKSENKNKLKLSRNIGVLIGKKGAFLKGLCFGLRSSCLEHFLGLDFLFFFDIRHGLAVTQGKVTYSKTYTCIFRLTIIGNRDIIQEI